MSWAVRIPADKAAAAASLRLRPGVEVLEGENTLWLRGTETSPELSRDLRKLPDAALFDVTEPLGALTPMGAKIPAGKLPQGEWTPIASFFKPAPQPAALSGLAAREISMSVVATGGDQRPSVLIAHWAEWFDYAMNAPRVRLAPLRFALSQDGRAIVRGAPLPPIRGTRFYEHGDVAIPCGFALQPAIDAPEVRALIGADEGELVLLHPDATWEGIAQYCFLPAARANVRATDRISSSAAGGP